MGNQQSQRPFSSQGHSLGGVPISGTETPPSSQPRQQAQRPSPAQSMPTEGGHTVGGGGSSPARQKVQDRLQAAAQPTKEEDVAKARDARAAAAKAAEERAKKSAASQPAKVSKITAPMPERTVYE